MLARDEGLSQWSQPESTRIEPRVPARRRAEYDALRRFLMTFARPFDRAAPMVAHRIALGCLGDEHLWRDMRLERRDDLRVLFERHFPQLADENHRDMRWKKFLYKRLCGWEGFAH